MDEQKKDRRYDLDGEALMTQVLCDLVNRYPGLPDGEKITFATLPTTGGLSLYPGTGAAIESERTSVTGRVRQTCQYPFFIGWRAAAPREQQRVAMKEWLDQLGRWLERQPVIIDGETQQLETYPPVAAGRQITAISRQIAGYLDERDDHQVETWAISLICKYENIYQIIRRL